MNPVRSGITLSVNICLKRILINCPKSTIHICVACRSKEGLFDYDASLLRLASSTKIPDLKRKRVRKINDSVSATERDIALKEKASKSLINCAQREALIIPDIAKSHNPTTVDTLPID